MINYIRFFLIGIILPISTITAQTDTKPPSIEKTQALLGEEIDLDRVIPLQTEEFSKERSFSGP